MMLPKSLTGYLIECSVLCVAVSLGTAFAQQVADSPPTHASVQAAGSSGVPSPSLGAASDCTVIVSTRDAVRCITAAHRTGPIPTIDRGHAYTLSELIDIAESASPETRIGWAESKLAFERVGVQRAEYLPLLSFAAQGSDQRNIVPFPKPLAPRGYVTVEQPIALAQLELEYSLLDFGRHARLESTKALEIASTLQLGRIHQTIAFKTAQQFYRTQEMVGQLDAARTILETANTLEQNAQSQFDNGRATLPDLQNAQAGTAEARFNLAAAEGAVQKQKLALTETIGVEPSAEIEISVGGPKATEAFDVSAHSLIEQAARSRPDLLAWAQNLKSAREEYHSARATYLPTVKLDASGGQTSTWPAADYGQLGPASVSTWSVSGQLRWDVFNGARKHQIDAALAREQSTAEHQRAARDAVTREVWQAFVDYKTALAQERASESFLASAKTSYDSSLDAFKYGVRSLVDVVQAERQLAQARQENVSARARRLESAVGLSYATGDLLEQSPASAGVQHE
jgi:outer membrane protein TolC